VGQSYTFQIVGQLTIRDQTREATFDATVTPAAAGTLQGKVTTTIDYTDWGLSVPSVPLRHRPSRNSHPEPGLRCKRELIPPDQL